MARRRPPVRQDEIVRVFAARLREVRHARGLTQAQLAERAGVTPSYMTRLENATVAPGIDMAARLAAALDTTAADLLPAAAPPDPAAALQREARRLFDQLVRDADAVAFMVPLMARVVSRS